jgi:hypothetical protein
VCKLYNVENATMRSRLTLLILLILFGCAAAPVKRPWKLELMTSGGFTGRGSGEITIESSGTIRVKTAAGKECTVTATADELKRYESLLAAAQPEKWKPSYAPENRCCDRIEYDLALTIAEKTYKTEWISSPLPMPKDLTAIGDALLATMREHACTQ